MIDESQYQQDERFMRAALEEARAAAEEDEVPIGAVIVCNGKIIGRGHNLTQRLNDVTAHAEMQAITAASEYLGGKYLPECTLYVTVEPCMMCAGALGWAQIGRIVYAADDPKRGYSTMLNPDKPKLSPLHPKTLITQGILADQAADLMQSFFKSKR
ncbi:MAG: nucleoside deaminase [Prevotella sp.]|nr:nucleoside deaminase [Bacteroides sp.]MCM1366596.1 nucleoside deaminase [Prevotella sp.]MCM1437307.1 nucleoside deaminase [Prevotella sp.]